MITTFITLFALYYIVVFFILSGKIKLPIRASPSAAPEQPPEQTEDFIGKSTPIYIVSEPPAPEVENFPGEPDLYIPDEPPPENVDSELDEQSTPPDEFETDNVSFQDLEQMADVMTNKKNETEELDKASETLEKMQGTAYLQTLLKQIPGAEEKASKLLSERMKRYNQTESEETEETTDNEQLKNFNMAGYL